MTSTHRLPSRTQIKSEKETYFCGSLVLVKNECDSRFDIIDGQQRITTFIIISCVLRYLFFDNLQDRAKNYIEKSIQDEFKDDNGKRKRKLKFLTDERHQLDFEKTVLEKIEFKDTKNFEKKFSKNKYLQNAHFIKSFFEEKIDEHKDNQHNLDGDFVMWFFENVVLTVITCPSQDSAIRIFNVLNDRGMPLSSTDILKASLMQELGENEDRRTFKATWKTISQKLEHEEFDLSYN